MSAGSSPGASQSERGSRGRGAAAWLAAAWLATSPDVLAAQQPAAQEQSAAQEQPSEQEKIAATFKLKEISFMYHSALARYSCGALEGRIASIFRALGARDDVRVRASGCDVGDVPTSDPMGTWQSPTDRYRTSADPWASSRNRNTRYEQTADVRVSAMMPVEVTPEVLAQMDKDKSRRELISRVTRNPAASFDDPVVFAARRERVVLSHHTIGLEPEECELLEQMSSTAFRKLGMRVVGGGSSCSRDQVSHIPPQLTIETLMPVRLEGPKLPPPAESDPEPPK